MNLEPIIKMLDEIITDRSVPKNIRNIIDEAKNRLLDEKTEPEVKLNAAISILDEICNDINMPVYTRTEIWNIVSMLESIGKK